LLFYNLFLPLDKKDVWVYNTLVTLNMKGRGYEEDYFVLSVGADAVGGWLQVAGHDRSPSENSLL
jgi:hypothetical protein